MARQPARQAWTRKSEQEAQARLKRDHPLVLVYTRQSRSDFDREGNARGPSLDQQREAYRGITELAGCPVESFQDADRSGRETTQRPGYLKMVERARTAPAGLIGAIFCYDQDRLHRNVVEFYRFMEECEELGILVFDAGGLVRNEDELAWGIKAVVAAVERKKIARRVRDNLHHLIEQGRLLGHAPVGYRRRNDGHGPLEIDPETAPLVRQVFELYATGRFSVNTLARHLNESGVPVPQNRDFTKTTTSWQRGNLKDLLKNASYTGKLRREGGLRPATHPALVTDELFEKCQQVRRGNLRRRTEYRFHRNIYPLQPLLVCGRCGGSLRGRHRPELKRPRHWYVCANRWLRKCDLPWLSGEVLEEAVAFDLRRYVPGETPDPDLLRRLNIGLGKESDRRADLKRTLKSLDERELRVNDMYERNTLDQTEHIRRVGLINLERQAARQQSQQALQADLTWAAQRIQDMVAIWEKADLAERATMVGEVYRQIEVDRSESGIEMVATPSPKWTPFFQRVMRVYGTTVERKPKLLPVAVGVDSGGLQGLGRQIAPGADSGARPR